MSNKNLGLVITDGVGSRNFLLSNFMEQASNRFEKVVVYSGIDINFIDTNDFKSNVKIIELPFYKESKKVWFFRKLKEVAHMQLHKSFYGINDNLKRGYPKNNSKKALLIKLIYKISSVFHSEKNIKFYEKLQFHSFKKNEVTLQYTSLLEKENLDIVFFTHQRPPFLAPVLFCAKKLNIKTTSFIFSWDNLASKGRMLGEFDGYMVWSDLMKKEMLYFYPNTKKNNVQIVGTPQFEPYVMDKYKISKKEFLTKFNLEENKKIICYSCADADIGRNDETHIRAIMNFIKHNKDLQLLVRTSPAEDGERFKNLIKEFPQIKWNIPKWISTRQNHAETWSQRLPSVEDVIDLKSILSFSDVNVNMLSTMSLDFMLFDKPVINTVFGNENNGLYNDQRFLNFVHYKYVIDSKAVTISKNQEDLFSQLEEAIDNSEKRSKNRKELIDLEIGKPLEGTSKRMVKILKEF